MKMPEMTEHPEKRVLIATGAYCMLMFFMIPIVLLFLTTGFHQEDQVLSWVQLGYHVVNIFALAYIFRDHLSDCWTMVQLQTKKVLLTALAGVAAAVILVLIIRVVGPLVIEVPELAVNSVPVVELELFLFPKQLAQTQPVLGTIVVVCSSVSVACLLYGTGFAPACSNRSWLGYLVVIGVLILHRNFYYYTVGTVEQAVSAFIVQLPIHLVACMTYHYTDSIWTPIFMLAGVNLLGCLGVI